MTSPTSISTLFAPPPGGPGQPITYRQGKILSWDAATWENEIDVGGSVLIDVPVLGGAEAVLFQIGDIVGLNVVRAVTQRGRGSTTWAIVGQFVIPNTPQVGKILTADPLFLPGSVGYYAGPSSTLPEGWLVCNGSAISRTTFLTLFNAIGTTWGAGDGSTTFNLPNFVNRWLVGSGGLYTLGTTGGVDIHTHTNPTTSGGSSHSHTNPTTSGGSAHDHSQGSTGTHTGHQHGIQDGSDATSSVGAGAIVVSHQTHTHFGLTNSGGSHSHTNPDTGTESSHTHTQGSTGSESAHTHTQGATGSESNVPPWAAVLPIIRF